MTIYSKLLAVGQNNGPYSNLVYRTPMGSTSILKHINAINNGTLSADVFVELPLSSGSRWGGFMFTVPSNSLINVETWIVIPESWPLGVTWFGDCFITWWLSGSELSGTPPTETVPDTLKATPPSPWTGTIPGF